MSTHVVTATTDCATAIVSIDQPAAVVADLTAATPELVSPYVDGVRHDIVQTRDQAVVLTLVPGSEAAPHMATGHSLHRYYRRAGSTFRHLEHYEIADLFGRRPHARLTATTDWDVRLSRYTTGQGGVANLSVRIVVKNEGRGLARFPSLSVDEPGGWPLKHQTGGIHHLPMIAPPRGWHQRYAGGADTVVYPDDELVVTTLSAEIKTEQREYPDLALRYRVLADGAFPEDGTLVVRGEEIRVAAVAAFESQNLPYFGRPMFGPRVV